MLVVDGIVNFSCRRNADFGCAFAAHRVSPFVALGFGCGQPNLIATKIVVMSNNALIVLNTIPGFNLHLLACSDWL